MSIITDCTSPKAMFPNADLAALTMLDETGFGHLTCADLTALTVLVIGVTLIGFICTATIVYTSLKLALGRF